MELRLLIYLRCERLSWINPGRFNVIIRILLSERKGGASEAEKETSQWKDRSESEKEIKLWK